LFKRNEQASIDTSLFIGHIIKGHYLKISTKKIEKVRGNKHPRDKEVDFEVM